MKTIRSGKLASASAGTDEFLRAPLVFDPGARWEYGISTDCIFNTFFWVDREKDICAVLLAQMLPFGDAGQGVRPAVFH